MLFVTVFIRAGVTEPFGQIYLLDSRDKFPNFGICNDKTVLTPGPTKYPCDLSLWDIECTLYWLRAFGVGEVGDAV